MKHFFFIILLISLVFPVQIKAQDTIKYYKIDASTGEKIYAATDYFDKNGNESTPESIQKDKVVRKQVREITYYK